ncbi:MAG: hypothetical protein FD180_94 [Planctomycetota bacterium]|nr:MAG: hypothetical protein FD180_94 [Planctomycetota bacterium]
MLDERQPEVQSFASAAIPLVAAAIHAAAALAMLIVIRPAADDGIPWPARIEWLESHLALWRASWICWMLGALSLLAFYGLWGSHVRSRTAARVALGIACLGACFDLTWEARLVAANRENLYLVLLGAGFWTTVYANGFYCVAGVILTMATRGMPSWLRVWSWAIWIVGFGMTASGMAEWMPGLKVTTGVITVLLVPWFVVLGRFLNKGAAPA